MNVPFSYTASSESGVNETSTSEGSQLTVKHRVILELNIIIVLKEIVNLRNVIVGAQTRLGSAHVIDACINVHVLEVVACLNRVLYELEECGFVRGG